MKRNVLALSFFVLLFSSRAMTQETCEGLSPSFTVSWSIFNDEVNAEDRSAIETAMAELPTLTYKIGDQTTHSPSLAAEIAKDSGKPIQYVVAFNTFDNDQEAFNALVTKTEERATDFTKYPYRCSFSRAYVVGILRHGNEDINRSSTLVKTAMDTVTMSYVVGEQSCDSAAEAKELASQSGERTTYVVNDEKAECEMTARLNLARAKYRAGVEALVKHDKKDWFK